MSRHYSSFFTITTESEILQTLEPGNFTFLTKLNFQNLGLSYKQKIYHLASNEVEYIKFTFESDMEGILRLKSESNCLSMKNILSYVMGKKI